MTESRRAAKTPKRFAAGGGWRAVATAIVIAGATAAYAPAGLAATPVLVDGNPDCRDLGYAFGFKIDADPVNGQYFFVSGTQNELLTSLTTPGAPSDPSNSVSILNKNDTTNTFDWLASIGIDAVIVKAQDANAYYYSPEALSDTGLMAPEGKDISHVEFCYDYELTATKTATAAYTRTYTWTIDKSVAPSAHVGFIGDTFSSDYDVAVDQTATDSAWAVSGDIVVNNPTPFSVDFSVSDLVGGVEATVSCPTTTLAAGASTTCTYSASLGAGIDGTNVATITSTTAGVGGATATAGYTFGAPTTVVGYPTINVNDSVKGALGSASGDKTFEYAGNFSCPKDTSKYTDGVYTFSVPNKATISETGQFDDANVDVTCYAPLISKTANTASLDREYSYTIGKTVSPPESQSGYAGDTLSWVWTVVVSVSSSDANVLVSGQITVVNTHPSAAMTVALADVLNDGTAATIAAGATCDYAAGMLTVPAGGTAVCDYTATPSDGTATLNTATATLNSVNFTATADVSFAVTDVNKKATVTDDQIGLSETLEGVGGSWSASDSHTCSMSGATYGPDGQYNGSESNTATVTWGGGSAQAIASTSYLCEAGFVDLLKTTNGAVDSTMSWSFKLYAGPDGFGGTVIGQGNTSGDDDGVLDFGYPALSPDLTYTVCELGIPAGYSSIWQVNGVIVNPYNPDANNVNPEDLGNRCVDFGAGTTIAVEVGETIHFTVDNTQPGGAPRTPGYWKNWNACTIGGQAANAARNGGWEEGFWLIEDVLDPSIGGGIVWDDILSDSLLVAITSCEEAVEILDQRVVNVNGNVGDGRKLASDAARTLAMHLLAAQLNFGAGACTTPTVLAKALEAETLLDKLNFDGTKTTAYLRPQDADYALALSLARYLDQYNNGAFCGN